MLKKRTVWGFYLY